MGWFYLGKVRVLLHELFSTRQSWVPLHELVLTRQSEGAAT